MTLFFNGHISVVTSEALGYLGFVVKNATITNILFKDINFFDNRIIKFITILNNLIFGVNNAASDTLLQT